MFDYDRQAYLLHYRGFLGIPRMKVVTLDSYDVKHALQKEPSPRRVQARQRLQVVLSIVMMKNRRKLDWDEFRLDPVSHDGYDIAALV
jgi:hypothetical protein